MTSGVEQKYTPTLEQQGAIQMSTENKSFKLSAFAGSGKTSTLKLINEAKNNQKGIYLAFNKVIAIEAQKKFNQNVKCKTFHSLAYEGVPRFITDKLNNPRIMPSTLQSQLGLRNTNLAKAKDPKSSMQCSGYEQIFIIERAIKQFCQSNTTEPTIEQVMRAMPSWAHKDYCGGLAAKLLPQVHAYWSMAISEKTDFKISHDIYLKYWAMTNPIIPFDYILQDEAQDIDRLMLQILKNQNTQVIMVGDKHQNIYEWRGTMNAMKDFNAPEMLLTKSFRFGGQVADTANLILKKMLNERIKLIGNEAIKSQVGMSEDIDTYIVRTNAGGFRLALQLIMCGKKPRLEVDTNSLKTQIEDAITLQNNGTISKNSEFYGFTSWNEVSEYVEGNPASDLTPLVSMINKNTPVFLLNVLNQLSNANDSDTLIITAHKSKGSEYGRVKLCDDFKWNEKDKEKALLSPAESRLLYVASTRAIQHLDYSNLDELFERMKKI